MRRVRAAPTLLTLANLISGFGSMTMSIRSLDVVTPAEKAPIYLTYAVWLLALAMIFDLLDGRVARMTGLTSRFGAELDSLADVVSFGVAPAVLASVIMRSSNLEMYYQRAGWVMLALYVAAAAVRLARYNVEASNSEAAHAEEKPAAAGTKSKGKEYFTGLPSPAAAGMAVSPVLFYAWLLEQRGVDTVLLHRIFAIGLPILMLGLAWLMISRVRYVHVGNWLSGRRQKLVPVMLLVSVLALAVAYKFIVPPVAVSIYVVGCLVWDLGRRMANARTRRRLMRQGLNVPGENPPNPPQGA